MHARYSELEGRRALVTGGASGIGLAIATALAAQGVRVGVADIDVTAAQSAAGSLGSGAVAVQMDVSERASVERGFAEAFIHERFRDLYRVVASPHEALAVIEALVAAALPT